MRKSKVLSKRGEGITAGGREVHLRDLQSWMFTAGESHTLIGNYLTTLGRKPKDDMKRIYRFNSFR